MANLPNRRIGKFFLGYELLQDEPELVSFLLNTFLRLIPLRVEYMVFRDAYEIVGISERFKETPVGAIPYEYELMITQREEIEETGGIRYKGRFIEK